MKRIASLFLVLCIICSVFPSAAASNSDGEIVILYTNDVHCAVDNHIGYAGLAAYKSEMTALYGADMVTLVDAGDAVQGNSLGTLSKGLYPVEIMNQVGYDIVAFGNHEFDYGMDSFFELMDKHEASVISCNFIDLVTNQTVFEPYKIIDYGDTQIAYIGITTPKTITSSTPAYFQGSDGSYIYGFCEGDNGWELYDAVQSAAKAARENGADIVVAVGHCGVGEAFSPWQSTDIIANTTGIDVFIDGHSHSVIEGELYKNKDKENVLLTSTGTGLEYIGKLIVSPGGKITSELISGYDKRDKSTEDFISSKKDENKDLLETVVARSSVPLIISNPETGARLIRNSETNLGDLVADAYRALLETDVAIVNGGGIRAGINAGSITYNDIISVHPFGNMACAVEATGQEILDVLEMGARNVPSETGGFMQVSGLTYEIHTYIDSSVKLDDKGNFIRVDGEYRVRNVRIGGKPLDPKKTYTLASHNYLIKNGGDGYPCFMDNKLLLDEVMLDNQVLISYIVDKLGGVVGSEYANIYGQGRIIIKELPFVDLIPGEWYMEPISYVYKNGLMVGTSIDIFSPHEPLSRAQFLSILYRHAGSPENDGRASKLFKDCEDDTWYSKAIVWAWENNIFKGGSLLKPQESMTREETAVLLYRYIQSLGGGYSGDMKYDLEFEDSGDVSQSAREAVAYCAENGLLTGLPSGKFAPAQETSRAMAAAVLQRFGAFSVTLESAA
jgi:2',3'-cyclic-nucleotide 2'-phosphodiesterase (5'-nucleotidase family)